MYRVERTVVDINGKKLWVWSVFYDNEIMSYFADKTSAESFKERFVKDDS